MGKRNIDRTPRNCDTCKRIFTPHNGSLHCGKCVYAKRKLKFLEKCPRCNGPKYGPAKNCMPCYKALGSPGNWRGGIAKNTGGYIIQWVREKKCYVAQHRLVMESIIGRELKKTEQVHHKNCLKWDNRPENLELWVKSQPTGARVKDLLEWAHKLIDEYGEIAHKVNT